VRPSASPGLFASLRGLLHSSAQLALVRLELLVTDLEYEKLRLAQVAVRGLLGLMLVGLGTLLAIGFILLLLWEEHRLMAIGVLTLLCLLGGAMLLRSAQRSLQDGEPMLGATRAEFERDEAALRE
jgi:uncharacterized membrane protein YqjE